MKKSIPLHLFLLLYVIALISLVSLPKVYAREFFLVGCLNPFTQKKLIELQAVIKEPKDHLTIFPVECSPPGPYSYELNFSIISKSLANEQSIKMSQDIRHSDKETIKKFLSITQQSGESDQSLLLDDVLFQDWHKSPDIKNLTEQFHLTVQQTRSSSPDFENLKKFYADNKRIHFSLQSNKDLREKQFIRVLLSGANQNQKILSQEGQDLFDNSLEEKENLKRNFLERQKKYHEGFPFRFQLKRALLDAGIDQTLEFMISTDPTSIHDFAFLDRKDERAIRQFLARLQARNSESRNTFSESNIKKWTEEIKKLKMGEIDEQFSLTRTFGINFKAYKKLGIEEKLTSAQKDFPELKLSKRAPPRNLYHWTSDSRLRRIASDNPNPKLIPLGHMPNKNAVAGDFPDLIARPGIFAWTDPITGMMATTHEVYARQEGDRPARLLAMKIRQNAKVAEIQTGINAEKVKPGSFDGIDLIYHEAQDMKGMRIFSEWIVLNPDAVEEFTADPKLLSPILKEELKKLKDLTSHYDPKEMFAPRYIFDREMRTEIIEDFLQKDSSDGISPELIRNMQLNDHESQTMCSVKYSKIIP
jgi:hypothetical protein